MNKNKKVREGICLAHEYVEAVAYYECEHEIPLETSTYMELINMLITLDSKEILNEFEQGTMETIIYILAMYNEELPNNTTWTDRVKCEYNNVKKTLIKN